MPVYAGEILGRIRTRRRCDWVRALSLWDVTLLLNCCNSWENLIMHKAEFLTVIRPVCLSLCRYYEEK